MRIYVDTSIVGGYYDKEFEEATKALFRKVEKSEIVLVVSELVEAELLRAPKNVRNHLNKYSKKQVQRVDLTEEAKLLADQYIAEKLLVQPAKPTANILQLPQSIKLMCL